MPSISNMLPASLRRSGPVIPVVRMQGAIMAGGSQFRQSLSLAAVAGPLERAFSMKKAPVVAISINSPGGSAVQSRQIFQRIRQLAEVNKKRVLVFVEDVAASGGYMIALAGDEIIADETSIVGSIGVVAATFGFVEAIGKLGVERRVYTAGKNKVTLDPFQPEKKEDIAHLKALQEEIHTIFIDMVKERRGGKLDEEADLFNGLYWTGRKALELGLIDNLGHLGQIIKQRYGDKAELRLIQPKRNLFGRPVGAAISQGSGDLAGQIAAGLPAGIWDEAAERSLWARYGL